MVLSVLWSRILSSGPTDVMLSAAAVVAIVAYAARSVTAHETWEL